MVPDRSQPLVLPFHQNDTSLTLGVEMEVQLLDPHSYRLVPKAPEILDRMHHPQLAKEMFRSTLEMITGVCHSVQEVHQDLGATLSQVRQTTRDMDLLMASTGTHPFANYNNRRLSPSPRYTELLERNKWLIQRMAVYGLHVHIGMRDGDDCIRFNNFFLHFVPHLIALSASSPFWKGRDTGLDASRPTTYESHPTSGIPVVVKDWQAFNDLYEVLVRTGSIESMKDIWWDLRPSPGYGTLEIRICDAPATMLELESIVAWIHLLSHWFRDHQEEFIRRNTQTPKEWLLRENKWRAIRHGIRAEIISHEKLTTRTLSDHILHWMEKLQPYVKQLNYEPYIACLKDIIQKGNSASRQRAVMKKTRDILEVVRHNVAEFEKGSPIWPDEDK